MTQRQQSHPAGTFPTCPECRFEARHFIDYRMRPVGGHFFACACGDSPKFDTLPKALRHWCAARNVSMTVRPVVPVREAQA